MGYKILLVEDNEAILESIKLKLEEEQFHVITATNGQEAIEHFDAFSFDLVLLDLLLPELSGSNVLQYIRKKSDVPIIIISMKSTDVEKAINLGLGADDYLAKPFSMLELLARVKAVIRRSKHSNAVKVQNIYKVGDLLVNLNNFSVKNGDHMINLTTKEFEIFKLFILNSDKVFSKKDIFRLVWHEDDSRNDNVINVHIKNLREKIEKDPNYPEYIMTLWGFGYKLGQKVSKVETEHGK